MRQEPSDIQDNWIERRGHERIRASGEVHLQTPGGDWRGSLWDLSESGARLEISNPPPPGVTALLKWDSLELFCRIIWVKSDGCGVSFDRPISSSLVEKAVGERPAVPEGPKAAMGNIPIGQRRGRTFLRSTDDSGG